jgi:membrane protein DedA with SNARE-associated domain
VAFFTALENAFPFVPSDVGVLIIAALLLRGGPLDPFTLWAAATIGNSLGALVPWAVARRYGPRIAQSKVGRRLLPPDLVSLVEKEYVRFGLPGIFLCRLIPAVRFIVAPFAGLVGLTLARTLLPFTLASALWYALIVGGGWLLGGRREVLLEYFRDLNLGLALFAVAAMMGGVVWWYRRRQRVGRAAGEHLHAILERAIAELRRTPPADGSRVPSPAAAMLLVEYAALDEELPPGALLALEGHARERWGLGAATRGIDPGVDYLSHARAAAAATDHGERVALAAEMWRLLLSDGTLSEHEAALLGRIAVYLSLTPADITEARRQATAPGGAPPP